MSEIKIGDKFNRLEVISDIVIHSHRKCYLCKCFCGSEVFVRIDKLVNGGKKSCGCFKTDSLIARGRAKGVWSKYFPMQYLSSFCKSARLRNISWEINIYDLDVIYERQNGKCYYTGQDLILPNCKTSGQYTKKSFNVSIDRKDNDLGYHPDNICLCLKHVNMCKHILHHNDFIKLCKQVATHVSLHTDQPEN